MLRTNLLPLLDLSRLLSASLLLALTLLQESLGDQNMVLGGDGTAVKLRLVRSPGHTLEYDQGERRLENCRLRDILSGG